MILPFPPELVEPAPEFMFPGETVDPVLPYPGQPDSGNPPCDPCKGLRDQLTAHEKKLEDYLANPNAYDNLGILGKGYDEYIIPGRIRSLQKQIENFRKQLAECEARHGFT